MDWTNEKSGFDSLQEQYIFLFSIASRSTLERTQRLIQYVPNVVSSGVTRQGREADSSPPCSAEVKNDGAIHPLLHTSSWRNA
jgi:hypothetical protein